MLGIGSDIGGSIRVPAAFCGIAGIRVSLVVLLFHGIRVSALNGAHRQHQLWNYTAGKWTCETILRFQKNVDFS